MIRLFFIVFFLFSCAEKVSFNTDKEGESYIYRLPSSDYKNHYMTCNLIASSTFQGYIYDSPRKNCVFLEIDKGPASLFEDNSLFMQVYPFKMNERNLSYGDSLRIYTLDRETSQTLVESLILDAHIVNLELEKEGSLFFQEHRFEVCDLDEEWNGLQIVIYERRSDEDPAPIRVSKFLKPPFLIHPEYFRDSKGNELLAYHPFSSYIPDFSADSNQYYELAEEICSPFSEAQ